MAHAFNLAGIPARHVDKDTPQKERLEVFEQTESGKNLIICNVGVLSLGVDLPFISVISMCRPTRSLILYVQQAGRGTRTNTGKEDFIILDHAGNVHRHGFITDPFEPILDGVPKREPQPPSGLSTCAECFCIYDNKLEICPECGSAKPKLLRSVRHESGQLKEIKKRKPNENVSAEKLQADIEELRRIAAAKGYRPGWIYHKIKSRYGENAAKEVWR